MKRIAKWPLFLIAIPWALLLLLLQTVHGGGMVRGGDPAISAAGLSDRLPVPSGDSPFKSISSVIGLDLTTEQQRKLGTANLSYTNKLSEWRTSAQAALEPLTGDAYDAELFKRNLLLEDIIHDSEIAALAILTPAQAEKWETSQLNNQLNNRLRTLGLSDVQKGKINLQVAETAKKLATAKDKETLVQVRGDFWKQITGLLSDIQLTELFNPTFARGRDSGPTAGRGLGGGGTSGGGFGGMTTTSPASAPATRPN
jgi:hypothetical protein